MTKRALDGDRAGLARLITLIENDVCDLSHLVAAISERPLRARMIGVTGPPGAGKSTFVGGMLRLLLESAGRVAVIAVDPSSPASRGAVLGDRLRMAGLHHEPRLFIRSVAARGQLGGLSGKTGIIADLLDAAGYEHILIETVGVGQSEVAIAALAGLTTVVLAPGLGDDVQSLKAGVLEIADLLVVNKADLPGASTLVSHLQGLRAGADGAGAIPILTTVATSGKGLTEVLAMWGEISHLAPRSGRQSRLWALLCDEALKRCRERLEGARSCPSMSRVLMDLLEGAAEFEVCMAQLLRHAMAHNEAADRGGS